MSVATFRVGSFVTGLLLVTAVAAAQTGTNGE